MLNARSLCILSVASAAVGVALLLDGGRSWTTLTLSSAVFLILATIGLTVTLALLRKTCLDLGRRIRDGGLSPETSPEVSDTGFAFPNIACKAMMAGNVADGPASARAVAVMQDVTREREVAEMKNDFVSMVSHELRTPLASIRAYVEMLIDGEAEEPKVQREFYDVIQSEANRLGRLIDNILNISRIESGLVKVHRQPQSVAMVARDAIEVISPQARQKQIALVEDLASPNYQTSADRDMLYQAFLNLLSNAVKFTPPGGTITIKIDVDEAKRRIITRITDTGVGIPPKALPYVFDKFFRAEANNRMAAGTGLGLSLVKHIIGTVHDGHLFLESQVGKGSCFGFDLELCE